MLIKEKALKISNCTDVPRITDESQNHYNRRCALEKNSDDTRMIYVCYISKGNCIESLPV